MLPAVAFPEGFRNFPAAFAMLMIANSEGLCSQVQAHTVWRRLDFQGFLFAPCPSTHSFSHSPGTRAWNRLLCTT